jgi:hypothetical protein
MNVVDFLNDQHSLEDLEKLGIKCAHISDKNVYILNYDQIASPKENELVRSCRSLILRKDGNWRLMARSFIRFFNYGENKQETKTIESNIDKCEVLEKKDGSLITVTYFDNEWHVFTRGSNADVNPFRGMQGSERSESETFGSKVRKYLNLTLLNKDWSYVFELCVPGANITQYKTECISLLTIVDKTSNSELNINQVDSMAQEHKWDRPTRFHFKTMEELFATLALTSYDYEGYVAQLGSLRVKIKKDDYKRLHLLGSSTLNTQSLIRVCLLGEVDELLTISCLRQYEERLAELKVVTEKALKDLAETWAKNEHLKGDAKGFALKVAKHPWRSILFLLRTNSLAFPIAFRELSDKLKDTCVGIVATYI